MTERKIALGEDRTFNIADTGLTDSVRSFRPRGRIDRVWQSDPSAINHQQEKQLGC